MDGSIRSPVTSFHERPPILDTRCAWRAARMVKRISVLGENLEGFGIHGGFRKPHALRAVARNGIRNPGCPR